MFVEVDDKLIRVWGNDPLRYKIILHLDTSVDILLEASETALGTRYFGRQRLFSTHYIFLRCSSIFPFVCLA